MSIIDDNAPWEDEDKAMAEQLATIEPDVFQWRLDELSDMRSRMQELIAGYENMRSAEQWKALDDMKVVERTLFSAWAWLEKHRERFGT